VLIVILEGSFHQQVRFQFKEENIKALHLEHIFVWCWSSDISESG